jgi:hypothetical protein
MTSKLDTRLKRELLVLGKPYTLIISPNGLALTPRASERATSWRGSIWSAVMRRSRSR